MAEAGDAVQLVIAAARGGYLLAKGSYLLLLKMLQLTQSLYYSSWAGSVKYKKLIKMKGPDLVFLNAGTEDAAALEAIEKNMEEHGVLFARLPDLCGGDGRTQYAIGSDDACKMRAVLLDHANSKYKSIRFGPISEAEYLHTGIGPDGKENEELRKMRESGKENEELRKMRESAKEGVKTQPEPEMGKAEKEPEKKEAKEAKKVKPEPDPAVGKDPADTPDIQKQRLKETFRDPRIRMRELDAEGRSSDYVFLPGEPISRNGRFFEFELDRDNSIFIPVGDALVAENQAKYGPSQKHGAVLGSPVGHERNAAEDRAGNKQGCTVPGRSPAESAFKESGHSEGDCPESGSPETGAEEDAVRKGGGCKWVFPNMKTAGRRRTGPSSSSSFLFSSTLATASACSRSAM